MSIYETGLGTESSQLHPAVAGITVASRRVDLSR